MLPPWAHGPVLAVMALSAGLWLTTAQSVKAQSILSWEAGFGAGLSTVSEYEPAAPASRPWRLCAVFPHIKDAYWLAVNYGMVEEARRLGVEMHFFEAGGYEQLEAQRAQVSACGRDPKIDALIVGTVSKSGLNATLRPIAARIPVVATVNAIDDVGVSGKVGVDWSEMGRATGAYLAQRFAGQGPEVPIAWFPGPHSVSEPTDRAFRQAIAGSRVVIRAAAWGDTGKSVQRNLLQAALDDHPDLQFVVGNALMAEAAVSVLRERGLQDRIGVVSTYFTPGVYRGILRGRILAAPTDAPVLQARMSVGLAVDLLEKRPVRRYVGPLVRILDQNTIRQEDVDQSLPPALFTPNFHYRP